MPLPPQKKTGSGIPPPTEKTGSGTPPPTEKPDVPSPVTVEKTGAPPPTKKTVAALATDAIKWSTLTLRGYTDWVVVDGDGAVCKCKFIYAYSPVHNKHIDMLIVL